MVDYNSHKVPELKKLLADRSLPTTGVKAELISRLQEDDKTKSSVSPATISAPPAGEDEIDWDEDDTKATTAPAAAAVAAGGKGPVPTPIAVPNQISATNPSKTSDLKVAEPAPSKDTKPVTEAAVETKPEEPKENFSANLAQTDAEKEAIKRAKRAEKFGVTVDADDEAKKKAERAKKFGLEGEKVDIQGLDSALPERRERKRGREEQGGRRGGAKRQNGGNGGGRNARSGVAGGNGVRKTGGGGASGGGGRRITDDPTEKAKAEARALKFKSA